jgi:hypothetical protein
MKRAGTAIALAGAVLMLPAAAIAGVVVKSTGPSSTRYPVGTKMDDNASITLRDGDAVTVLTAEGTRIIRGAGTFRVGDRPQVASDRFAALTRKRAATRVRTGAVRNVIDDEVTNPSLWYVDITRSGTVCLYDLATVRLWRPATEGMATYRIAAHGAGEAHADVTFDDTVTVAALDPARLPVSEGGQYVITGPGGTTTAHINFVLLPGDFDEPDTLAEALIERGCTVQVESLANAFE